ncbi:MAG: hypothetical protein JSR78_11205, partial [Proteobacteria bacterium]|nr:hypothetical protein [Pseudomonadota bacterium]
FIAHDTSAEMNLDLLVWATAPAEALAFWRAYFDITDMNAELMLVPTSHPKPGALPWHSLDGVRTAESL